jgi:hypothetical protein
MILDRADPARREQTRKRQLQRLRNILKQKRDLERQMLQLSASFESDIVKCSKILTAVLNKRIEQL